MATQEVDEDAVIDVVAGIDIGKAEVTVCLREPGHGRRRQQTTRTCTTMTRSLLDLADWLNAHHTTRIVMESTSDYWRPVYYLLEASGLDPWLVNAKDVRHLPGRTKTDREDAVWLAKLAERGMLRPCFVPPPLIRDLRALTRFRYDLVKARTAEKNRIEKLLEDACIKLSVVASDIFGVSGRLMMTALINGERDPATLAQLARTRLRAKLGSLEEAFHGHFTDQHAYLLAAHLRRIDSTTADISDVEAQINTLLKPFAAAVAAVTSVPGIRNTLAVIILAEIGLNMAQFPTAAHLCSWAGLTPKTSQSAGRTVGPAKTAPGNRYLAAALGEAAVAVSKTETFWGARYRRIAHRRGKLRAVVATERALLTTIWHLLTYPDQPLKDLGPDHWTRTTNPQTEINRHLKALHNLGYTTTLTPAA